MKVLIVKMSSMGDIVHAQPVVADLLRQHPGVVIDWVAERAFAGIPAMNLGIRQVIPIAWRAWRRSLSKPDTRAALQAFVRTLRRESYDHIIDCQGLIKSAAVSRIARAAQRTGLAWDSAREPWASLAYSRKAEVPWSLHVVARNRAVAGAALGYTPEGPARFGLQVPALVAEWLPVLPRPVVLIPGASRPEKLWPETHWVEVGRWLHARGAQLIWLWGSPAERERVQRIAQACGGAVHDASDAARPTPAPLAPPASVLPPFLAVQAAAGLIASAVAVVGLDTGFTHLAGALGRPTVGIFCDFDATQCAVSGDAPCESFGGIGQVPAVSEICAALVRIAPRLEEAR